VDPYRFLAVCSLAFLTVFILLAVLAFGMRIITLLFAPRRGVDAAIIAAVASSVSVVSPGARVVRFEEIPCSPSTRPRPFG
jgi:hypothetical protein